MNQKLASGLNRRKHYESIIKSNYTTDEAKAIAKSLMGTDTYVPESNSKQLELADDRISTTGADSELASLLSRATTGGTIKAEDIAKSEINIEEAVKQIENIYSSKHFLWLDRIVLLKDKEFLKIYKRKQKEVNCEPRGSQSTSFNNIINLIIL